MTDFIAPGYSMIIKNPMDFSTMKEKIKNNGYQSIEELKVVPQLLFWLQICIMLNWLELRFIYENMKISKETVLLPEEMFPV